MLSRGSVCPPPGTERKELWNEDPEVVSQAFRDDVKMPAGLFGRAGDFLAQSSDFGFVGLRPLEVIEPAVHVSFELGGGYGLT